MTDDDPVGAVGSDELISNSRHQRYDYPFAARIQDTHMHKGSCLCGEVTFKVRGDLPEASSCHCRNCRKATGHHEAGVDVKKSSVTISGEANLTWYFSSEKVRRGFCSTCGSPMFFDPPEADWIGLMLGTFDGPTGTKIAAHIFVGSKGDYYEICDGAPQYMTIPASS